MAVAAGHPRSAKVSYDGPPRAAGRGQRSVEEDSMTNNREQGRRDVMGLEPGSGLSRRVFLGAVAAGAALLGTKSANAGGGSLAAKPPAGFVPLSIPGRI